MKVLVTGNLGYVGNVLTRMLLNQKFDVTGYDVGFYPQGFLGLENFEYQQIKKDIRYVSMEDLKDVSAICHLAALSNDPLGEINPNLTENINYKATVRLAKLAKEANVEIVTNAAANIPYSSRERFLAKKI